MELTPNIIQFSTIQLYGSQSQVEYFKSIDPRNTSIYFTNNEDKREKEAFIEVLRIKDNKSHSGLFLRLPGELYFTQLYGDGISSSRGNMTSGRAINPWREKHNQEIKFFQHGENLMISLNSMSFNFLKLVGNYGIQSIPNTLIELSNILTASYIELPREVRTIEYCVQTISTKDKTPSYLVIENSTYSSRYGDYCVHLLKKTEKGELLSEQLIVRSFERYRDGGTTIIEMQDKSGNPYQFFSPSPFNKSKNTKATLNDIEVIDLESDSTIRKSIISLLNIIEEE